MKKLSLFLCSLALAFSAHAKVEVDQPAPAFSLTATDGKTVSLADHKGKYVVLEWTNHLCPYVQKHYESGNMQGLQKKYTDKDIVWLSVISSAPGKQGHVSAAEADKLTQGRNAAPSAVLLDPEGSVGQLYGARTTPHMYIIDPEGKLRYAGAIDSIKSANPADIAKATNYVDQGLGELLAGKDVSVKASRPYGCSVKYK